MEELIVPPNDMMKNMKPGDSTMRMCGWCKYAGSGLIMGNCFIRGRCGLIPLPLNDVNLVPPVEIDEKNPKKALRIYSDFDRKDNMAIEGFKKIKETLEKIFSDCGSDEISIDGQLMWNTECIIVRGLNNDSIRKEILSRIDGWTDFFVKRITERKAFVLRLQKD